jgi:long-chain acyl-CoA synthetase
MDGLTIPSMFEQSVQTYPDNVMMMEKRDGAYRNSTYREIHEQVLACAAGLIEYGIRKGDRIALISEGRNDWIIAELGILYAGAVNVPLSVKIDELSEIKFRLAHSGCRLAIVSRSQAPKVFQIKNDLADLEKIIVLDPIDRMNDDEMLFADLLERGQTYLQSNADSFAGIWQGIGPDDYANICYTSGTTADPKGIILTHRNYVVNVRQATALLPIPDWYTTLLILPWDHSFAHTAGLYTLMRNGGCIASVQSGKTAIETLRNIPVNIREVKPVFLLSVPALAKSFKKNIEAAIRGKGARVEKLFQKALETAYAYNGIGSDRGKGWRKIHKPMYALYDKILFGKIRENFGGRLEFFIGGGALLDIELQRFFYAIGIPMYQGYGLSEAAPIISANVPAQHRLGSSGKVVVDLELKICDERGNEVPVGQKGEIVVKGENVMAGYWNNKAATEKTIRDGWLFTGDLGYLDSDGFLYVLGREKSLLIGHDGEKYSPEGIEEMLVEHSPYIDQVMLYNNQSPYTIALIVPNQEAIRRWAKQEDISLHSPEGQDRVIGLIESEIAQYKTGGKQSELFPDRWLPATFAILGEGFTEQNKLMNSTLKMVRGKIIEFYTNRLDYLFSAEGKNVRNHQNRTIIRRMVDSDKNE